MATSNHCPRCGLALQAGSEGVCASCRARPRSKRPRRHAELDFTADAPGPPKRSRESSGYRALVLAGVALFLLLGTALTGYCFAVTFGDRPENPSGGGGGTPPPPPPPEDWRATLHDLRAL